jgi:hypothetical protein
VVGIPRGIVAAAIFIIMPTDQLCIHGFMIHLAPLFLGLHFAALRVAA